MNIPCKEINKMKNINKFLAILLISLFSIPAIAQDDCSRSTEGTEFWLGFMMNRYKKSDHELSITVTSKVATSGKVYVGNDTSPYVEFSVAANSSKTMFLSPATDFEVLSSESEGVYKGIHVITDDPVNLYALNYQRMSSDATLVYPIDALGKDYYALCYEPNYNGKYDEKETGKNSEFLIIATEDNTNVTITPTKKTDGLKPANVPFTITMYKGEAYQVQSANTDQDTEQGDLTGSRILSDKNIAVFSGNYATVVPDTASGAWDHLYEQIPPVETWAREYVTAPIKTRLWDTFRVLAAYDNTNISVNYGAPVKLSAGEFYEFNSYGNNTAQLIQGTKPFLLAQYSNSKNADGVGESDPFMIIVSPTAQKVNKITFEAFDSEIINNYYVNIVTPKDNKENILLDGVAVNEFTDMGWADHNYSYAQVNITKGTHNIESTDTESGFLAYVYGYGAVESYGYNVGANLDILLDLGGDEVNNELVICEDESVVFAPGEIFSSYLWSDGSTEETLEASTAGEYWVEVSIQGCTLRDTVQLVTTPKPKPDLGDDRKICGGQSVELSTINDTGFFYWEDGSKSESRTITEGGTYWLMKGISYSCYGVDTMNVIVYDLPSYSTPDEITFCNEKEFEIAATADYVDSGEWKSSSPMITITQIDDLSASVIALQDGKYEFIHESKNELACEYGDTITVNVTTSPTATYEIDSLTCKGYSFTINYTGNAGEDAVFNWDFGGLEVQSGEGAGAFVISAGAENNYPLNITLSVSENNCASEPEVVEIKKIPKQNITVEPLEGCPMLDVNFKTLLSDGENYSVNFGNDNTGNLINGDNIQSYENSGIYSFSIIASNNSGCENTITGTINVFEIPDALTNIDENVCYSDTFTVSYSGTDPIQSTDWDFSDFENDAIISGSNNNAYILSAKGEESKQIGLTVVSDNGCVSEKVNVTVKIKPESEISVDINEGCPPLDVAFEALNNNTSYNYKWSFEDNTETEGANVNYEFQNTGLQDVTLIISNSNNGCENEIQLEDIVNIFSLPVIDILPAGNTFPDKSAILFENNGENIIKLEWEFGDGTTSTEIKPEHIYPGVGKYDMKLTATSENNCIAEQTKTIQIVRTDLEIPNTIIPEGHNAANQCFTPVEADMVASAYQLMIFNRWGEKIFESTEPTSWCGTLESGTIAPQGSYAWKLKFIDFSGVEFNKAGAILLLR